MSTARRVIVVASIFDGCDVTSENLIQRHVTLRHTDRTVTCCMHLETVRAKYPLYCGTVQGRAKYAIRWGVVRVGLYSPAITTLHVYSRRGLFHRPLCIPKPWLPPRVSGVEVLRIKYSAQMNSFASYCRRCRKPCRCNM